jgi:PP-loop superfamily ATP-utilizing enzyme
MTTESLVAFIPQIAAIVAIGVSVGTYFQSRRKQLHTEKTTAYEAWQEYGSAMRKEIADMRSEIDELHSLVETQRERIKVLEQYVHGSVLLDNQIRAEGKNPVWDYRKVEGEQ